MTNVEEEFVIEKLAYKPKSTLRKISVIGAGPVGLACAHAILNQKLANEICLIDANNNAICGEIMDLRLAATLLENIRITGGSDYMLTQNSQIIIITGSSKQKSGETRLEQLQRGTDYMRSIIPEIMEYNPNPILLVVADPCEIMTYLAWRMSGLAKNRVLGTGTSPDTIRFQMLLAERLGVVPCECHGWIVGEHGGASVPVWSSVNVGGIRLRDVYPNMGLKDDEDDWNALHRKVISTQSDLIEKKGQASWGKGACCAMLVNDILNNTGRIRVVSTSAQDQYGIEKNIFLSLPCVVTSEGVTNVVKLHLDQNEIESLQNCARILTKNMCHVRS